MTIFLERVSFEVQLCIRVLSLMIIIILIIFLQRIFLKSQVKTFGCYKGRSDCGHFDLADWGTRVRIRCQAIPALNVYAIRSVGEAILPRSLHDKVCPSWASGEPRVRLLTEGTLGRGVNPSGTTVPARGWARMRSRPSADVALTWTALYQPCMACSEDVFQPD